MMVLSIFLWGEAARALKVSKPRISQLLSAGNSMACCKTGGAWLRAHPSSATVNMRTGFVRTVWSAFYAHVGKP